MPHPIALCEIRAALFDVDGTLIDSVDMVVRGIADTVETHLSYRPPDEEVRNLIGVPLRRQMVRYGADPDDVERLDTMVNAAIARFEDYSHLERVFVPAVETLRLLHRNGVKTALVTSKSRAEVEPFWSRFPARDAVDVVVCADDVTHPKPDPESARVACARLEVTPADAVFIGDSIYDLRCARDAGIASVAVAYGAAAHDVLAAEKPDLLLRDPESLFAWAEAAFLQTPCRERS